MSAKIKARRLVIAVSLTAAAVAFLIFYKGATAMSQQPIFPSRIEIALGQSGEYLEKQYGALVKADRKILVLTFSPLTPIAMASA